MILSKRIFRNFLTTLFFAITSHACYADNAIDVVESADSIQIRYKGKLVLNYQLSDLEPPTGVDSAYLKNGFIHPLNSPSGHALTGIHPDDHYHHTGIWQAWVKTKYGSHTPDFWNLKNIQLSRENKKSKSTPARVNCIGIKSIHDNGFTVILHHLAYLKGAVQEPTVILVENLKISLSVIEGNYIIDYDSIQENVANDNLEFPSYRYGGGLAFRGPHHWNADNSDYMSSKGLSRSNSHTSKAKWVAMYGSISPEESESHGLALLCHSQNFDAPQHIRTWDNGKMFFNYVPTQSKPFEIKAGQRIIQKYRIVAYSGLPNQNLLESLYKSYIDQ